MKRFVLLTIVMFITSSAWAGVTYKFTSVTDGRGGSTLAGTVSAEDGNMRIDFTSGDGVMFRNGTTVISKDGGKTVYVLDPAEKTYYSVDLEQLFASFGAMMKSMGTDFDISIDNQKMSVKNEGRGAPIEGYSTTKYKVDASYDLNMKMMGMEIKSSMSTSAQVWATEDLPREYVTFLQQRGLKTGIEGFDKLVDAQLGNVKGFPLKQIMKTKTKTRGRTQESTTTTTVSNIDKVDVAASQFEIPEGYQEIEQPIPHMPTRPR